MQSLSEKQPLAQGAAVLLDTTYAGREKRHGDNRGRARNN